MFRQIHSGLWREPWFEQWQPEAKLLFLYLVSCSDTRVSGFLTHTVPRLAFSTGLTPSAVEIALRAMAPKVKWWPEKATLWVMRFWRWQGGGPKWLAAVQHEVAELPEYAQLAFYAEYPDIPRGSHTLSIPHPYPIDTLSIPNGEKEKEKEKEKHKHKHKHKHTPPHIRGPDPRSPEFLKGMIEKFGATLGENGVQEEIENALAHKAADKWKNKERYVQNWLKREVERRGNSQGHTTPIPNGIAPTQVPTAFSPFAKYK